MLRIRFNLITIALAFVATSSLFWSSVACADLVVRWDLSGNGGAPTGQNATDSDANVSGLELQYGPGVSPATTNNTFTAQGWDDEPSSDPALDQDYVSFGFVVDADYEVELESLLITTRSLASSTGDYGPGTMGLFYSGDGFATNHYTFHQTGANVDHTVDLTGLAPLSGEVEFRIIEIGNLDYNGSGNTDEAGRFRLFDHKDTGDIRLQGSVVIAVPEPSAFLFGGLAVGLCGVQYARKKLTAVQGQSA